MFEVSIVSQSNNRYDHCNRKSSNQYENDIQIQFHSFDDRIMQFYCYIRVWVDIDTCHFKGYCGNDILRTLDWLGNLFK